MLLAVLVAGAAEASAQLARYEFSESHMGMRVRIVLYAPGEDAARQAARAAFDRIAALEDVLGDRRERSEARLLTDSVGRPVRVSRDLWRVLSRALTLAAQTDGAFDPTIGPYTELWRRARGTGRLPSDSLLREAGTRVGWRQLVLDSVENTVVVRAAGMRLDLGALAKGYILDAALAVLRGRGITRALIEAGGDIVVGDAPPGASGWSVDAGRVGPPPAARVRSLVNASLATSGEEGQHLVVGGVRYSPVIDGRTGRALTSGARARVIAADGITAGGLATALTLLDPAARRALLLQYRGAVAEVDGERKAGANR